MSVRLASKLLALVNDGGCHIVRLLIVQHWRNRVARGMLGWSGINCDSESAIGIAHHSTPTRRSSHRHGPSIEIHACGYRPAFDGQQPRLCGVKQLV
jgi:hypothetical protein